MGEEPLQQAGLVSKGRARRTPRRRRECAALAGLLMHQDGSMHEWVAGTAWDGGGEPVLEESFWPTMARRVGVAARQAGSAFVPLGDGDLEDILCLKEESTVTRDNCVSFRGRG